jgi:2-isopropylmalate synthase
MEIFETTLRDGEQEAFVHFLPQHKAELARLLEDLGVDVIDAGFPAASAVDLEGVTCVAENTDDVKLSILCRPISKDFQIAYQAVKGASQRSRVATAVRPYDLLLSESDEHQRGCQRTIEKSCQLMTDARALFPAVQYYLVCAGSRDRSFLVELSAAVAEAGATHIIIADTLSTMEPSSLGHLTQQIRANLPSTVTLGVHCHNLLGLGLANSIAGIQNGATQVEVTVSNLGDAGGNTALEQMLAYASFFPTNDPRFACNCDLEKLHGVTQKVLDLSGLKPSPNQPLIGTHSFLVETGIHQSIPPGVIHQTFTPEKIGRFSEMVIGRHSGISGIRSKLQGLNVSTQDLNPNHLYREVMNVAEQHGIVTDEQLKTIAYSLKTYPACA